MTNEHHSAGTDSELQPVQARGLTTIQSSAGYRLDNAPTELARIVASNQGWSTDDYGIIYDELGDQLATCIEELTTMLIRNGCFTHNERDTPNGINWGGSYDPSAGSMIGGVQGNSTNRLAEVLRLLG